ncbi:MAG TPA: ATP-binding protein, partial [Polyangia bacterium]|nr:ATP-binding protein [Polyangia bacterium]
RSPRMPGSATSTLKLRPADPFDLIRWLARSQSDPRKAVAELVQNSLDANARRVAIERRRIRRAPALVIRDDGEGIVPELAREAALRAIATNIGHSRKRGLSPRERHDEMVAGKYGIGLLGFWAIGHRMDIRSRVGGGEVWVLRLVEDQERAELLRDRLAFESADTFTEVVISEMHDSAQRLLTGRRLNDYLGSELRGMLLSTGATLEIHDGLARGLVERTFTVVPRRFVGERLAVPEIAPVEGHLPARVELYLARGDDRAAVEVSCAGTLVADDAAELRGEGLDRSPWTGRGLTGLIEFPAFQIPPGTRRGIVPDAASEAFARALAAYAPLVEAELARFDRERQATTSRQLLAELRRALRGLRARLPQYDLPKVEEVPPGVDGTTPVAGSGALPEGLPVADGPPAGGPEAPAEAEPAPAEEPSLFPPGPLASVRIAPAEIALAPGRERRLQAMAVDRDGRRVRGEVAMAWSSDSSAIAIVGEGAKPLVRAQADARPGLQATIGIVATQAAARAEASATVVVTDRPEPTGDLAAGIPEPELVDDPGARWRSRFDGQRWQVNASHEDYIALRAEPRTRLRYLLALFAKEVALHAHGVPGSEAALESLVEILAHAERNLASV